jgi:hypothetical protein
MLDVKHFRIVPLFTSLACLLVLPGIASAAPGGAGAAPVVPSATIAMQATPTEAPPPPPPPAAPPGVKFEGNGATLKLGFLIQPQYEFDTGTATTTTRNSVFFLRRTRLLAGMTVGSTFELFFDTEAFNLGRVNGVGSSMVSNVQDAQITWKPMDEFKLDVGYFLVPLAHNSLQSAATLLGLDYFAFAFQQNAGMLNYVSRDVGVQARGLIANHLEYRLALLTGRRADPVMGADPQSRTSPRIAARVQYNVLDPETGMFYGGTYAGAKKVLSFGAGIDHQSDYNAFAVDGFLDLPLGANVLTAQADLIRYDGGTWIPNLAQQTDIMAEAGFRFGALKLEPIVRVEQLHLDNSTDGAPSTLRVSGGLAYWWMNFTITLKAFVTYVKPDSATQRSFTQLNLQLQFYVF